MLTVRGLGDILRDLAAMGFYARWGVLSCRDVGGVHERARIWIHASHSSCERQQRNVKKQVYRFASFPWGKDVRGVEDLRGRSDLPEPIVRGGSDGLADRMDRLKAIGNGQVSIVAATAFRILSGE